MVSENYGSFGQASMRNSQNFKFSKNYATVYFESDFPSTLTGVVGALCAKEMSCFSFINIRIITGLHTTKIEGLSWMDE